MSEEEGRCYSVAGIAGEGANATVYTCFDVTDEDKEFPVAIKRNYVDKQISFTGTIREADVTVRVRGHPCMARVDVILYERPVEMEEYVSDDRKEDSIYLVMDHATLDLFTYIYSETRHEDEMKNIMEMILLGVEYFHGKKMIHRDIKPANVLIYRYEEGKMTTAIIDYGISKMVCDHEPNTPRAVTSWYRSPEVCNDKGYGYPADLWSVGCVFYEMAAGAPLIEVTEDQFDEMGKLLADMIPEDFEERKVKLSNLIKENEGLLHDDDNFITLLAGLLDPNPETRLTATNALDLPFFDDLREDIEEIREDFPPIADPLPLYTIEPSDARRTAFELAKTIFESRSQFPWYKHRIMFLAVSLFDRYLAKDPSFDDEEDVQIKFLSCLYLSIKYYLTLTVPPSYPDIVSEEYSTPEIMKRIEEFEEILFSDVCDFYLYEPTIYEGYQGEMTEEIAEKLFRFYTDPKLKLEKINPERMAKMALKS